MLLLVVDLPAWGVLEVPDVEVHAVKSVVPEAPILLGP
jgi:hypothetical protein